jgi:hypothetical protein
LAALLKRAIDEDRYPLSPRITALRGILAKLEGSKPAPVSLPPLRYYAPPRAKSRVRRAPGRSTHHAGNVIFPTDIELC